MKYLLLLLLPCFIFGLTLDEKVGQLLVVTFKGETLNESAQRLIDEAHVGGFIFFSSQNKLQTQQQVRELTGSLDDYSPIPLITCLDQEGGEISHLGLEFLHTPDASIFGAMRDSEALKTTSHRVARQLYEMGIVLNLAPVVDVKTCLENPAIRERSFSSDPHVVIEKARVLLEAYRDEQVGTCLKHFPGIGGLSKDPHHCLPTLDRPWEGLLSVELLPFNELHPLVPAIMTTHVNVPAIDTEYPITFSQTALDWLRSIGFEGLIVTDSLSMTGILSQCGNSYAEAAIRAFEAGHDILLIGMDYRTGEDLTETIIGVHRALVQAVESGRLSRERLDQSIERIMQFKRVMNLIK